MNQLESDANLARLRNPTVRHLVVLLMETGLRGGDACCARRSTRSSRTVIAVKLDQVEGPQEHALVMPAIPDQVERRDAVRTARDCLPVDDAGPRLEPRHGLDDPREPPGQVVARPAVEPHPLAILAGDAAEAVVLDLVPPAVTGRRTLGRCGRHGTMTRPAGNANATCRLNNTRLARFKYHFVAPGTLGSELNLVVVGPSPRLRWTGDRSPRSQLPQPCGGLALFVLCLPPGAHRPRCGPGREAARNDPAQGETTGRINERDYPNIVELPVPSDGFRDKSVAMVAFHRERRIEIKHGRGRHGEGVSLCATVLRTRPWPMHSNISSAASA